MANQRANLPPRICHRVPRMGRGPSMLAGLGAAPAVNTIRGELQEVLGGGHLLEGDALGPRKHRVEGCLEAVSREHRAGHLLRFRDIEGFAPALRPEAVLRVGTSLARSVPLFDSRRFAEGP